MLAEPGFYVPDIDWRRTSRRVLTLEWLDGIKLTKRDELIAAGHDPKALAAILVRAFLRQAVVDGYFHADLHQGNLFALADGRRGGDRFRHHGPDRPPGAGLAGRDPLRPDHRQLRPRRRRSISRRNMCPSHHNVAEFATALRAVGEPIRGLPVKDISVGRMLEACSRSPATSTCRPSRTCCCCRRRW